MIAQASCVYKNSEASGCGENPLLEAPNLLDLYWRLRLVHMAERHVAALYPENVIESPIHLSVGQEVPAVALCSVLGANDLVAPTYRSHAVYLAKTRDLLGFFGELFGKTIGCTAGYGGSMHLSNRAGGVIGASAIVGTTIPVAAGYALAKKMNGEPGIVAVIFGDGATEEGAFYETLNFAVLRKLPMLFVCEDNQLAINTPHTKRRSVSISTLSSGFGLPRLLIEDTNEIVAAAEALSTLLTRCRQNVRPFLVVMKTTRLCEHVGPTIYASADIAHTHQIECIRDALLSKHVMADADITRTFKHLDENIELQIKSAIKKALLAT